MVKLPEISDDFMRQTLQKAKGYCLMILKAGPNRHQAGVEAIIWEHGRRNMALREAGVLPIVCPVGDGSEVTGIGVFNSTVTVEDARAILDDDPGVKAGVFVYEVHACRGFPGATLPA